MRSFSEVKPGDIVLIRRLWKIDGQSKYSFRFYWARVHDKIENNHLLIVRADDRDYLWMGWGTEVWDDPYEMFKCRIKKADYELGVLKCTLDEDTMLLDYKRVSLAIAQEIARLVVNLRDQYEQAKKQYETIVSEYQRFDWDEINNNREVTDGQ